MDPNELKSIIRATLISNPLKTTVKNLQNEFRNNEGIEFPYKKLGFGSFLDYLHSISDTVRVMGTGMHAEVRVVLDGKSAHIAALVSKQKTTKKKHHLGRPFVKERAKFIQPLQSIKVKSSFENRQASTRNLNAETNATFDVLTKNLKETLKLNDVLKDEQEGIIACENSEKTITVECDILEEEFNGQNYSNTAKTVNESTVLLRSDYNSSNNFNPGDIKLRKNYHSFYAGDNCNVNFNIVENNHKSNNIYSNETNFITKNSNFVKHDLNQTHVIHDNTTTDTVTDSLISNRTDDMITDNKNVNNSPAIYDKSTDISSEHTISTNVQNMIPEVVNVYHSNELFNTQNYTEDWSSTPHRTDGNHLNTSCTYTELNISSELDISDDALESVSQFDNTEYFSSDCAESVSSKILEDGKGNAEQQPRKGGYLAEKKKNRIHEKMNYKVPFTVQMNLNELILKFPGGLKCSKLMTEYDKNFEKGLNYQAYGYRSLMQMCCDLPGIFKYQHPDNGDYILFHADCDVPHVSQNSEIHQKLVEEKKEDPVVDRPAIPENMEEIFRSVLTLPKDVVQLDYKIPVQKVVAGIDDYIDVQISEVYDPSKFWFSLHTHIGKLNILMDELGEFYQENHAEYKISRCTIQQGLYCAALYMHEYHRAIVTDTMDYSETSLKVFFIDYGTVFMVSKDELYYLQEHFARLPAQALRGRLAKIHPPKKDDMWSMQSSQYFLKLIRNKECIAQIIGKDESTGIFELIIADTSGEEDIFINDCMVHAGYARFEFQGWSNVYNYGKYIPLVENIHLYPTFEEIESGKVASLNELLLIAGGALPLDKLYPQYFREKNVADDMSKKTRFPLNDTANVPQSPPSSCIEIIPEPPVSPVEKAPLRRPPGFYSPPPVEDNLKELQSKLSVNQLPVRTHQEMNQLFGSNSENLLYNNSRCESRISNVSENSRSASEMYENLCNPMNSRDSRLSYATDSQFHIPRNDTPMSNMSSISQNCYLQSQMDIQRNELQLLPSNSSFTGMPAIPQNHYFGASLISSCNIASPPSIPPVYYPQQLHFVNYNYPTVRLIPGYNYHQQQHMLYNNIAQPQPQFYPNNQQAPWPTTVSVENVKLTNINEESPIVTQVIKTNSREKDIPEEETVDVYSKKRFIVKGDIFGLSLHVILFNEEPHLLISEIHRLFPKQNLRMLKRTLFMEGSISIIDINPKMNQELFNELIQNEMVDEQDDIMDVIPLRNIVDVVKCLSNTAIPIEQLEPVLLEYNRDSSVWYNNV